MRPQPPAWVHGTLLVESELLNRPARSARRSIIIAAVAGCCWLGLALAAVVGG